MKFDLDYLDNLPKKVGIHRNADGTMVDRYNYSGGYYHKSNGKWPWKIAVQVFKRFNGKDANDAFSYFCKLVPKYQQEEFWKAMMTEEDAIRYRIYYRVVCYVNDDNKIVYLKSLAHRKRRTGTDPYLLNPVIVVKKVIEYFHKPYPGYGRRLAPRVTEVQEYECDAIFEVGTKDYYKHRFLDIVKQKRAYKRYRQSLKEKEYDFQRLKRLKKANERDIITRDRLGFNEDSFIGEEYHGQKRKKRKKESGNSNSGD